MLSLKKDDSDDIGLTKLLKEHFKKSTIGWEAKCDKCLKKCEHEVELKITKLPDILIICFQRYNYRSKRKLYSTISIKEKIDMEDFTDTRLGKQIVVINLEKSSTQYSLYGVINHSGSLDFGHYYA